MRIDQAKTLVSGDKVVNTFMMPLTVKSIKIAHNHREELLHVLVITTDELGKQETYHHEDVYLPDLDGVSDEEKSWLSWAKDNEDFLEEFDHLPSVRIIYMHGFADGYSHKKRVSAEEYLQK